MNRHELALWLNRYENALFWNRILYFLHLLPIPALRTYLEQAYRAVEIKEALRKAQTVLRILFQFFSTGLYFSVLLFSLNLFFRGRPWQGESGLFSFVCLGMLSILISGKFSGIELRPMAVLVHAFHLHPELFLRARKYRERRLLFATQCTGLVVGACMGLFPFYAPLFAFWRLFCLWVHDASSVRFIQKHQRVPWLRPIPGCILFVLFGGGGIAGALFAPIFVLRLALLVCGLSMLFCAPFLRKLWAKSCALNALDAFRQEYLSASRLSALSGKKLEQLQLDALYSDLGHDTTLPNRIRRLHGVAAMEAILLYRVERRKRKRRILFYGVLAVVLVFLLGLLKYFVSVNPDEVPKVCNDIRGATALIVFLSLYGPSQGQRYFWAVDRSFLPYAFYRRPEVVRALWKLRLKQGVRDNLPLLGLVIGAIGTGIWILDPSGGHVKIGFMLSLLYGTLRIFVAVFQLALYMAIQPFDREGKNLSPVHKAMSAGYSFLWVFVWNFARKRSQFSPEMIWAGIVILFGVLGIAYFLVPKLAQKHFRLRRE